MVLKRINILLTALALICTAFVIPWSDIPPYHLKVIEKRVNKFYKGEGVTLDMDDIKADTSLFGVGYSMPIKTDKDSLRGKLYYRKANACNFGGCTAVKCDTVPKDGFKEHIYYYAIVCEDTIRKMGVLEYESTYGYEIVSSAWLKQFYRDKIGNFVRNKNIDGISGATVSVNAMINDVNSLQD